MDWDKIKQINKELPEDIVNKKINGFSDVTGDFANLKVVEVEGINFKKTSLKGDFQFKLILYSEYIPSYRYQVLSFSYDATLEPIYLATETSIYEELYINKNKIKSWEEKVKVVENTKELEKLLDRIFLSESFTSVVNGLMKIAQKRFTNDLNDSRGIN